MHACRLQRLGQHVAGILLQVEECHPRVIGDKCPNECLADPAGTAGDDRDAARKTLVFGEAHAIRCSVEGAGVGAGRLACVTRPVILAASSAVKRWSSPMCSGRAPSERRVRTLNLLDRIRVPSEIRADTGTSTAVETLLRGESRHECRWPTRVIASCANNVRHLIRNRICAAREQPGRGDRARYRLALRRFIPWPTHGLRRAPRHARAHLRAPDRPIRSAPAGQFREPLRRLPCHGSRVVRAWPHHRFDARSRPRAWRLRTLACHH